MISDEKDLKNDGTESGMREDGHGKRNAMPRRRFVGAAGGVGVLLAVQARTALGQEMCESMSGDMSGNTSPHSEHLVPCISGQSPGFWSQPQKFSDWVGAVPPTFSSQGATTLLSGQGLGEDASMTNLETPGNDIFPSAVPPTFGSQGVMTSLSGQGQVKDASMTDPGTPVNDIFPGAVSEPPLPAQRTGLWEVISMEDHPNQVLRHLASAWLNANAISGYPLTPSQVKQMWLDLSTTGYYCPPNIDCADGGMSASEVKTYIESTYG